MNLIAFSPFYRYYRASSFARVCVLYALLIRCCLCFPFHLPSTGGKCCEFSSLYYNSLNVFGDARVFFLFKVTHECSVHFLDCCRFLYIFVEFLSKTVAHFLILFMKILRPRHINVSSLKKFIVS